MSLEQQFIAVLVATVLLGVIWITRRVRRAVRRRRSPQIHPKLRAYQPAEDVASLRRQEAERIVATSSTEQITGYRIIRQIEAVFVDGFRRPDEAIEGLKAAAAMKGGNAVTHVRHSPSQLGKYSASGDAVVVEPVGQHDSGEGTADAEQRSRDFDPS